ncbi:relaxase/mobilization nuclease domain-containing protein [Pedobacter borealis]|uniref:relaxase/mobilization nuclease domain-containing protein n=1 Tax=Pedobacter borealis TaxID=475254 RepID=UPI0004937E2B|nr:relaxase/mobilization nuclease domain-containing protein [Pedobacter borealis]
MVARIAHGQSIRGVLNYNENKVVDGDAKLLMACGYPLAPEDLSFKQKLHFFEMLTSQNEMARTNTLHISLNFSNREVIDDQLMERIAIDYMERIGFGQQPFLVYRHYDAAHAHMHIATVNIADGGERIETHNLGRNQSEKARREIENEYGLIKAEDQKKETEFLLSAVDLKKISYGRTETKKAISAIVREVTGSYRFTSIPELNSALAQFNVTAYQGEEGSKMKENGGLTYHIVDEEGKKLGVPIKASSIYSSPTLKNLQKKYAPNKEARKPYGQRLRHLLDKAIASSKTREELEAQLRCQGIRILFRENVQGQIYGVTFIDNGTRAVFNGSDLGKAYGAKAFLERLPKPVEPNERNSLVMSTGNIKIEPAPVTYPAGFDSPNKNYPAHDQPVILILVDTLLSDTYQENMPDPFRRKKKKRIQTE